MDIFRVGFRKNERVDHRHAAMGLTSSENSASHWKNRQTKIAVQVLLPVDEVLFGSGSQR
jgi:hypothetical protein